MVPSSKQITFPQRPGATKHRFSYWTLSFITIVKTVRWLPQHLSLTVPKPATPRLTCQGATTQDSGRSSVLCPSSQATRTGIAMDGEYPCLIFHDRWSNMMTNHIPIHIVPVQSCFARSIARRSYDRTVLPTRRIFQPQGTTTEYCQPDKRVVVHGYIG